MLKKILSKEGLGITSNYVLLCATLNINENVDKIRNVLSVFMFALIEVWNAHSPFLLVKQAEIENGLSFALFLHF